MVFNWHDAYVLLLLLLLLLLHNPLKIYGYVTSSDVKILALIERGEIIPLKKRKEIDIKILFVSDYYIWYCSKRVKHTVYQNGEKYFDFFPARLLISFYVYIAHISRLFFNNNNYISNVIIECNSRLLCQTYIESLFKNQRKDRTTMYWIWYRHPSSYGSIQWYRQWELKNKNNTVRWYY